MSRKEKTYFLAFRKRRGENDFFWLDKDYCFEEYSIDCGGKYWLADPFLFERDGKAYVFYEAYDMIRSIGKLGYSILDPDTKTLTPPKIILERKYHFSWPYIFEHNGEIYIMPETIGDYRVRLFRAVNFPDVWTEDEILINDIYSCDSILLDGSNGVRYLLTSEEYHNTPDGEYASCRVKNMLFEFMQDKLMLKPAGKINPEGKLAAEGDYGIRNAGKAFRAQGMLIRPGQDCKRTPGVAVPYGRGVVFFKVNSIEPYSEEVLFSISCDNIGDHLKPLSHEKVIGLHTYNFSLHFEVIDFAVMKYVPFTLRLCRKVLKVIKKFGKLFMKLFK